MLPQEEAEPLLAKPHYRALLRQLWQRQITAEQRALPEAAAEEKAALKAAKKGLKAFKDQPDWVQGAQLYPHQLQA